MLMFHVHVVLMAPFVQTVDPICDWGQLKMKISEFHQINAQKVRRSAL